MGCHDYSMKWNKLLVTFAGHRWHRFGGEEEHRLIQLATTGLERGLHVVVTSLRWNLRPSLRDVLTGQLELRMTPLDAEFRDAQKSLPDIPGRGVGHRGKHVHIALTTGQDVEHIRKLTAERGEEDLNMRVLPTNLSHSDLGDRLAFAQGGLGWIQSAGIIDSFRTSWSSGKPAAALQPRCGQSFNVCAQKTSKSSSPILAVACWEHRNTQFQSISVPA